MRHQIFIISGVSGAGKGTIIKGVLAKNKFNLKQALNVTTRAPEKRDKFDPHFKYVSYDQFKAMIRRRELLEYDFHHHQYYGTHRPTMERLLEYHNILMEADVNGALKIKEKLADVVLIYIMAELKTLRKRIKRRGNETNQEINLRMKRARLENDKGRTFDYLIENPEGYPEIAIKRVLAIIKKELQKR
jgi:guanylate kinase